MSLWRTTEDMLEFRNTGAHKEAIINSRKRDLPIEDNFLVMESDSLLDWKIAKKLLREKGRFTSSRTGSANKP